MSFIYVASPYTDPDPEVVKERFRKTELFITNALKRHYHVYSPIVHCHALAEKFDMPKDAAFWESYNSAMLAKASRFWILTLPGWKESKGVEGETALAKRLSIPQYLMEPELEYPLPKETILHD